ncbi:hypothetical protein LXL04_029600 [Taraxacum kok-saghyz]
MPPKSKSNRQQQTAAYVFVFSDILDSFERRICGKDLREMLESGMYSSKMFSHFREEFGEEELSVLPRHTKVIVTGNNRTKSVLVGLQGVVKKAVGLGGWHWLVLKNGVEVKLQRNALSVLEPPTGHEEDGELEFDNSSCGSDVGEKDHFFCKFMKLIPQKKLAIFVINLISVYNYSPAAGAMEFSKPSKPRVRYTRPWGPSQSTKPFNRSSCKEVQSNPKPNPCYTKVNFSKLGIDTLWRYYSTFNLGNIHSNPTKDQLVIAIQKHFASQKVNFSKLGIDTLWRYYSTFNLGNIHSNPTKDQLVIAIQKHFASQRVGEVEVITEFIHAAKKQKNGRKHRERS